MKLIKEKEIDGNTVYYGFSLGAYALMEIATKIHLDKIVLISPSPLFTDTVFDIPEEYRKDYVKNINIDKTLAETCNRITSPTEIYVGENEKDFMKNIALKIATHLNIQLHIVKGFEHEEGLFNKVYCDLSKS